MNRMTIMMLAVVFLMLTTVYLGMSLIGMPDCPIDPRTHDTGDSIQ